MLDCLTLLDTVIQIAEQELAALTNGELDEVELLAGERASRLAAAMALLDTAPQEGVQTRLTAFHAVQTKLRDEALRQREDLRQQLSQSRQQARRLSGYHKSISMAY